MYVCMYVCIYVCMYVCVYVCVYVCTCVFMYVCKFVCMYALAVLQEEFVKKDGNDGFCRKCGLFLFVYGVSVVLQTAWSPEGFWFCCCPSFLCFVYLSYY